GGSETFRTNDALSRMQENGRFALEIMRRDLREAGFTGCRRTLRAELPRPPAGTLALDVGVIRNTLNPAPAGGVDPLSFAFNFAEPILGYEATGDGTGASWTAGDVTMPAAAANPLITAALDDSDIVIVVAPRGPGVSLPPGAPAPVAATNFDIPVTNPDEFAVGDIVMITNCSNGAIMEVTGIVGGALQHAAAAGTPGNYMVEIGGGYNEGSEVLQIERVAYYIADSPVTGRRALFRNNQEIASDIEDLEVEYGIDTNADARINQYVTAANVAPIVTAAGILGPGESPWEYVRAARIHLLLSSGEEDNLAEVPVAGLNYAGGTFNAPAGDRRLFQVFSATVSLRNRLL
ncbi:MAG: PilW family protein, partial [Halieaceae bacterium]|nr:PilW family protein [Halieaceae bacterium]